MKLWFYAFFMAWGMFLSLPCPFPKWDEAARSRMLVCFPFIGAVVGGLWALFAWLLELISCPAPLTAVVLAALPFILTGFIHLDGFSDVSDAILSRRDPETRRRILKDPHIGAFGVIALVLLILAQFAVFLSIKKPDAAAISSLALGITPDMLSEQLSRPVEYSLQNGIVPSQKAAFLVSLGLIPVVSRACAALAVLNMKPMAGSQYAAMDGESTKKSGHSVFLAVLLVLSVLIPALLFSLSGLAPFAAAAAYPICALPAAKNLGGISGDVSGFALTLSELAGVLVLVLTMNAFAPAFEVML